MGNSAKLVKSFGGVLDLRILSFLRLALAALYNFDP